MRVIALFGRGNIGKTRCLGHLINLICREIEGCNRLFEGQDMRITLDYLGRRITICTWGDNEYEEKLNLEKIKKDNPDIAILVTRSKGGTVKEVERFCKKNNYQLKWVEKYVASFDNLSGHEYLNNLQAEQILDYVRGLIEGQLYYVDSKTAISIGEQTHYHLSLFRAEMPIEGFPRTFSLELTANELRYYEKEREIEEDDFVLYSPDSGNLFRYGNDVPRAAALRSESLELRQGLIDREVRGDDALVLNHNVPAWVRSYHVNVGHGNCSLILSKYENDYALWIVDCSTYDYLIRRDYSQNLYHCLKDIAADLNVKLESLHISRFMLTHTHFDHYNGLQYLIKLGMIDDQTLIYANLHYDCASPVWCSILKGLKTIHCRFVEPIYGNLTIGAIRIFHPECRIYKKSSSVVASVNNRIVKDTNNASVVYGIEFYGRIMVLPGDLEKIGFKEMSGHIPCRGNLSNTVYYMLSHHGSLNGHPDVMCMSKGGPNPKPLCCLSQNVTKAVLMGRNGAYHGIYNPMIESYWKGLCGSLVYTEKAPHYIEMEWGNGKVVMR